MQYIIACAFARTCGIDSLWVNDEKVGDGKSKVTTENSDGGIGIVWETPDFVDPLAWGDSLEKIDDLPVPLGPARTNRSI